MYRRLMLIKQLFKQTLVLTNNPSRLPFIPHQFSSVHPQLLKSTINCNFCTFNEEISNSHTRVQHLPLRGKDVKTVHDLFQFIDEAQRQFYVKLLLNVFPTIQFGELTEAQAIKLLKCCNRNIYDSSKEVRDKLCQTIYTNLIKSNLITHSICSTYLSVCIDNHALINVEHFLKSLPFEPDRTIFKDLIRIVCNKGHIQAALELLEVMKSKGIAIDEEVLNFLVYAHVFNNGIEAASPVLQTMKIAQIPENEGTKFEMLKAVICSNNEKEFTTFTSKYAFRLNDSTLLSVLECLGLTGNVAWLAKILTLLHEKPQTREFKVNLEQLCVHLIHMHQPEIAMSIYREFWAQPNERYGFFLLKEMLHCDLSLDVIVNLSKQLEESNLNETIFQDLTEIALRHKYVEASWRLLENMSVLRPHFFWPLLIHAARTEGEAGITNVVKRMIEKGVKPDYETLELHIIPFCQLNDTKLFVLKLENLGFTVKEILSPLISVLLHQNRVKEAVKLCNSYNVSIFGENFLISLTHAWKHSKDNDSIVFLLQKYCESVQIFDRRDFVGEFLINCMNFIRTGGDATNYRTLLKILKGKKLLISITSQDMLKNSLRAKITSDTLAKQIEESISSIADFSKQGEITNIPHPNKMNLNELECHLIELEEKSMETRGVLRKLIQMHCSSNNSERVNELHEKFIERGYTESAGMLSSLMQMYIQNDRIEEAWNAYTKLKMNYNSFSLDGFKIFYLARSLVQQSRYDDALNLVKTEFSSKKYVDNRTCVNLLHSYDNEEEQLRMFEFIIENKICEPVNVVLGPIVRLNLKKKHLEKAVETFVNFSKMYKCTPMQLEVFCAILEAKNEELLEKVIEATQSVHGTLGASMAMISSLAEMGNVNLLNKFLTTLPVHVRHEVNKRCERWIKEDKTLPLETLAKVSRKFPTIIDSEAIFSSLLQIYDLRGDCQSALNLYESEEVISENLKEKLVALLQKHNYKIPKNVNIKL